MGAKARASLTADPRRGEDEAKQVRIYSISRGRMRDATQADLDLHTTGSACYGALRTGLIAAITKAERYSADGSLSKLPASIPVEELKILLSDVDLKRVNWLAAKPRNIKESEERQKETLA